MKQQSTRSAFSYFHPMQTRWRDNDIYGHVNNVCYYSYFDTTANFFLIEQGGLDIHEGNEVAYVVASHCQYFSPMAHPQKFEVGFGVTQLGRSSVEYGFAVFPHELSDAIAVGGFTHVFVNRDTERSTPIPDAIRKALETVVL